MKNLSFKSKLAWLLGSSGVALFIAYKVIAQTPVASPIDFDNGPLVAKNQPSNVVLALSVEFPTSGGAYKDGTYVDGKEYVGYFNSSRCYSYPGYAGIPRASATYDAATDYFNPTGNTNATYHCNVAGSGTGFSGNYLNYATMSAPDILRMALTGGDRGIDEPTKTVLERGTIAPTGSAPFVRSVAAALVSRVSPFSLAVNLYAQNCADRVIFSTNSSVAVAQGCGAPAVGDATDLSPIVGTSVPSGTTTVTPTLPPKLQLGTTWVDTGALASATPTVGPVTVVTYYTTSQVLTTTPFTCPSAPCVTEAGPAVDTGIKQTTYLASGTATTPAPAGWPSSGGLNRTIQGYYWTGGTSTVAPPAAAESPAVPVSYFWAGGTSTVAPLAAAESPTVIRGYYATGGTTTIVPPALAEPIPLPQGYAWTDAGFDVFSYQGGGAPNTTNTATQNHYVCYDTAAPFRIRLGPQVANPVCPAAQTEFRYTSGSATNRRYWNYYTQGAPYYRAYAPYYRSYAAVYKTYAPYYVNYLRTDSYWTYTSYNKFRVYVETAVWANYAATAKAIVKPRPLVCDATEGPARTVVYGTGTSEMYNYCTKYDNGGTVGYKPEGQIQHNADNLRISVFSYLMDGGARYGGVMRAPMKYVGPNMYDTAGTLLTNPEKEWSLTTGQFTTKPITDSVSTGYTYTGVINYLNRFGKTGNYKTYDNVGELWYESLRYLQGLDPTPNSTAGMTEGMKDGYPVYSAWTDPVTSACQRRNFILGIGDTNQHYDRSLPGLTRAEQTAMHNEGTPAFDFTYTNSPTIKGVATVLNAHDWTKVMDGFERSGAPAVAYTDSLGNARTTSGFNTGRNATLGNLDTTATGSGNHSSYHWAGLAYWANTQAIRKDIKGGASMDKVRVKTFMIDVDENNRGSIDATIKQTGYYLAGKYGYFDDAAQSGNPFDTGAAENDRWADTGGAPKGYVLASQPQRLIGGVVKFFNDSVGSGNSFATVAVSNSSLSKQSPDGSQFVPSYIPGQWSGTVQKVALKLNTVTNTIEPGTVSWDAGAILTAASLDSGAVALPQVKPVDRKIYTYIAGTIPKAVSFTYAATNSGADLPASFNTVPYTAVVDNQAQARIDYLRGVRTKELDESFRTRVGIVGDIINSGPAYKGGANTALSGPDYPAYVAAKKNRTPVVYTGSNDGMLHAFKADNGQELFAYIPSGVLDKLPRLTSKNYIHELFVDAVPAVDEVRTSAGWKTVLASAMGGGAQGIFALDVSDPTTFNENNVMFEFTDRDDPHMGNVTSEPQFVKMLVPGSAPATYKYYIVVSSGYNNYRNDGTTTYVASPDQALFFLDVNKAIGTPWSEGTNYFKVVIPAADATKTNGLAKPGIRVGSAGEGIEFFAGDMQGNMWKASFPEGLNAAKVLTAVRKNGGGVVTPLFTARDASSNLQPITVAPVVYPYPGGGNMVVFGTGRLLESVDRGTTATHTFYGIWDSGQTNADSYNLLRAKLDAKTIDPTTKNISGPDSAYANTSSAKRGWYADLGVSRERMIVDPVATTGVVNMVSTIPPGSECSDDGLSNVYSLDPASGDSVADTEIGIGYFGKGFIIDLDTSTSTQSSYSDRGVSGSRTATKKVAVTNRGSTGQNVTKYFEVTYLRTGRVYWREVRDFNLVSQP